jgi:prepilin-type N-terminal cleavage/methylation domain-containing protein
MHFRTVKSEKRKVKRNQGFSLIELLVVIAIFGILTAIIVFKYGDFSNNVILTNMAYEMALSIREAQIYGISATQRTSFDSNFGINFYVDPSLGETQIYHLFEDKGTAGYDSEGACTSGDVEDVCIQEYVLQRNIQIVGLNTGEPGDCSPSDEVNIVFDRPSPEALIYKNSSTLELPFAQITLRTPEGSERFVVVNQTGQIFVTNDNQCD